MDYFSKEEADVIGEISNISIGSSATAMNMMLGQHGCNRRSGRSWQSR